ncbi:MAG: hypothetical protein QF363_11055 [Planctomycetaceae bacterium]|jgi:hypothetical protein|nr:hypothetical protein [Planctomycetaceae bacterium]
MRQIRLGTAKDAVLRSAPLLAAFLATICAPTLGWFILPSDKAPPAETTGTVTG